MIEPGAHRSWRSAAGAAAIVALVVVAPSCAWLGRASQPWAEQPNGGADNPVLSGDGRWVVFDSAASNLVAHDTNHQRDVFARDLSSGTTSLLSRSAAGVLGNGDGQRADVSADGRYVTFETRATNLVDASIEYPGGGLVNIVRLDRDSDADGRFDEPGQTLLGLITTNSDGDLAVGGRGPHITGDGVQISFTTTYPYIADPNAVDDAYTYFYGQGWFPLSVPGANCRASDTDIAADGRSAVFTTTCAAAGDTNGVADVYRRDLATNAVSRVSVGPAGEQGDDASSEPALAADGRRIAFTSRAANWVSGDTAQSDDVFVRDLTAATTTRVSRSTGGGQPMGSSGDPAISADGTTVGFTSLAANLVSGDTNGHRDGFVRRADGAGATARVSVSGSGGQGGGDSTNVALGSDGHLAVFATTASGLAGTDTNGASAVLLRDRSASTTTAVDVTPATALAADGPSRAPSLSADGHWVAFTSDASNLVPDDTNGMPDAFLRDLLTGRVERVSTDADGGDADGPSSAGGVSADGRYVVFDSSADDLVAGDTNGRPDVFLRDRTTGSTTRVSVGSNGAEAMGDSEGGTVSDDGRSVAFQSTADNLVGGDTNLQTDVFLRDRTAGTTQRVSVSATGGEGDDASVEPRIDPTGSTVTFTSFATTLDPADANPRSDVFARTGLRGATPSTVLVSRRATANGPVGNAASRAAAVGGPSGRFVAFLSTATDLVGNDTNGRDDVFVIDLGAAPGTATSRIDVTTAGAQANGAAEDVAVSGDGRFVAFTSAATNLVAGDGNAATDVFVRDRTAGRTTRASTDDSLHELASPSFAADLSTDGRYLAFTSLATPLAGDDNAAVDVFVRSSIAAEITSVNPSGIPRGSTRTLTIDGHGFLPGADVRMRTGSGLTFGPVTVVDEHRITVSATASATATTGTQTVLALNPGIAFGGQHGAADDCACLTVT